MPDFNEIINTLTNQMQETPVSCEQQTPMISIGGGTPPTINYNIPQQTGFTVSSLVSLEKDPNVFYPECSEKPANNLWDRLDAAMDEGGAKKYGELKKVYAKTTKGAEQIETDTQFGYFAVPEEEQKPGMLAARATMDTYPLGESRGQDNDNPNTTHGNTGVQTAMNTLNYDTEFIGSYYQQGLYPVPVKNLHGDFTLNFIPKREPQPEIYLAVQYKVQSFLGNYGAGKVVKTMTLMPGEETTISVKTFRETEEQKKYSDNVLDSFSQNSADNLERGFENESSTTKVSGGGGGFGLKLGPLSLGGNASKSTTSVSKTINKVLSKHIQESQAQRKVEVNNETTSSYKENEENTIVRKLENPNVSRVLNFTFRQMNQEYIVVTYIDDVSLVYTNGYPETERAVRLSELDDFLETYIQDSGKRTELRNKVIMQVYNFRDKGGTVIHDCFTEQTLDMDVPPSLEGQVEPETFTFWAKNEAFNQTVTGTTFSVPGIITQIERHILSTDSLIGEALLGHAEALDCYNIQLQQEKVRTAKTANLAELQQLSKIEQLPMDNPDTYKAVYDECCCKEDDTNEKG